MATVMVFYVNIKHKYSKDKLHKLKTNSHLPKEFSFLPAIVLVTINEYSYLRYLGKLRAVAQIYEERGSGHVLSSLQLSTTKGSSHAIVLER